MNDGKNADAFLLIIKETHPEIHIIFDLIEKGRLTPAEIAEVVHKMAIVRTSDDGYGKILIEMQTKPTEYYMRVRTIQDKVLRTLPDEVLI